MPCKAMQSLLYKDNRLNVPSNWYKALKDNVATGIFATILVDPLHEDPVVVLYRPGLFQSTPMLPDITTLLSY